MTGHTKQASGAWYGKPYYSLDAYLKNTYGEKIYKIAIDAGLTCPNRDGTAGVGGCIFCSQGGSGDFAVSLSGGERFQDCLARGKARLSGKPALRRYIAYFQAYTNTYGPVSYLNEIYRAALNDSEIAGISIATRPDCLPEEVLSLLSDLKKDYPDKFVWIELGLQTIHEKTAGFIRRGYSLSCFEYALDALQALSVPVVAHLILGLPGETRQAMYSSVSYLNDKAVWGVKLQLLHILKGTELAELYARDPGQVCCFRDRDDYLSTVIGCLLRLRPDMVVHRVTGDAPKPLLLWPMWSGDKRGVLNALHRQMKETHARQGGLYRGPS